MSSIHRPLIALALLASSAIGGVGCTETVPLDPRALADRGPDRIALDLGLAALDGAAAGEAGADAESPDGSTPDAAADGGEDGDGGSDAEGFDAGPADRQNGA